MIAYVDVFIDTLPDERAAFDVRVELHVNRPEYSPEDVKKACTSKSSLAADGEVAGPVIQLLISVSVANGGAGRAVVCD